MFHLVHSNHLIFCVCAYLAEDVEAEEEEGKGKYDRSMMPEQVISLEAPDEFLKLRIMDLPESVVSGTHNTEEGLLRRIAEYRAINTEDETVLNFFDELEIHPEKIGKMVLLVLAVLFLFLPLQSL